MKKLLALLILPMGLWGQTNPTAQSLPYSQNFGTTTFTSMPAGMAAWNGLSGAGISTQSAAESSTPGGNASVTTATSAQTTGGVYGYSVSSNGRVYVQTSSNTSEGANQIALAINTTGQTSIVVSYDVEIISAQPRTVGIVLQYRIGTSGSWTTVTGTNNPASQTGGSAGVIASPSLTLPSAANNQSVVQLRWATWRGTQSGNSSGIAIDNISVTGTACTAPANPSGSISQTNNCGSVDLVYSGTPTNIYWQTTSTGTSTANPVSSNLNMTSTGTRHARAYDGSSCWSSGTVSSTVSSITNNTTISSHPSNSSIFAGANTSFSVSATNSPSYQWQVNTGSGFTNISNGGVYSNATTATLNITGATLGMDGYTYRCVVTSASPCTNVVNSNSAILNVADGPCVTQNFNSFTSGAPAGWSGSGCSNYNSGSTGFFGNSANSARFDDSGDNLVTPSTTNGARSLSFWMRGASVSGASAFLIEGFNGTSWVTIENITSISNFAVTKSYTSTSSPALPEGITQFRFTYTKVNGNLAFDDVEIYCDNCKSNVALISTTGTNNYIVQCQSYDAWNYYGNGTNYYFAINKNGNTLTPTVSITVSSAAVDSSKSSNGANQEHASYLMKRYWNVDCGGCTPTANGGVSVRFFYDPADSTAARTAMRNAYLALKASNPNTLADTTASMQWIKNTNGVPYSPTMFTGNKMTVPHIKLSPTYGTLNGVRYVEFSGITSFSGGGGGFGFGPSGGGGGGIGLPVTWAGFDALANADHTELVWQTASEQNTSHFEVEASVDGKAFAKISEDIPAAGNSASLLRYTYIDRDLAPIKYYRLKQMDIEGSYDYSKIIVAKRGSEVYQDFEAIAYPYSHTEDRQYLLILKNKSADFSTIEVLDCMGKPVYKANTTNRSEILDLSHLTSGIYMLSVWNGGERQVVRIAL